MQPELALFLTMFTTLLAIINPLESLPVFLEMLEGKDNAAQRKVAFRSCLYATMLCLFFLFFGAYLLKIFGVPLSMVRIAGGIVLTRIGFDLFAPSGSGGSMVKPADPNANIAFMPLAIPLMFGPGAIATILGMTATVKQSHDELFSFAAIAGAILATMLVTYLCFSFAGTLAKRLGATGIDAATRIVGFFVSAIGVGLVFDGVIEALQTHGVKMPH